MRTKFALDGSAAAVQDEYQRGANPVLTQRLVL